VTSRITPSFRRALRALSAAEQKAARRAYRQFVNDPARRSLRFKKLAGHENLWSVRVTLNVRAVGHREGETITWVWIGSHAEFDSRFG
jgi:mRNA-degrading endonuclease RelE of RelBE toxin-antitoxin system